MSRGPPEHVRRDLRRAGRLEWWSLFWLGTIILAMYLAMGSSQAMKTAWIEDMLSLLPPALFLIARRFEDRPPTAAYPYGFHRVGSLAFFLAAGALVAMGLFLIWESASALIRREHPTIGSVSILGRDVWLGWLMIAALVYSVVPPVILGRMKKPLARAGMDKILWTDADMNAADWKTGLAGIAGVLGIGLGYWWADAAAAGIIAFDILRDGFRNIRISVAELLDGAPRKLDSPDIHPIVGRLSGEAAERFPGCRVQVCETGRYVRANLVDETGEELRARAAQALVGPDEAWRLVALGRVLRDLPARARQDGGEE